MMTLAEKKLLLSIDRKIGSTGRRLEPQELSLYRKLMARFVEANIQLSLARTNDRTGCQAC